MIYTSYFAKLRSLPEHIIPISICAKAPDWYKGYQYKKLAPKYDFFMEWKKTHDNNYYVEHFNKEVLDPINADTVVEELYRITGNLALNPLLFNDRSLIPDIALICYEKPSDFCHRHLVADWLNRNGFECKEWK